MARAFVLLAALLVGGKVEAVESRQVASDDKPLNATMGLELFQVPLSDLCWVMEKRSGIPHHAADAATGDLLASVVGELSVAELQQALADVLGVVWKREGKGEATRYVAARVPDRLAEEQRAQAESVYR